MTEVTPVVFIVEKQNTLQHVSDLLHLFHHRNHNQHRHSVWWRHFSVFRRQLNLLVKNISQLNAVPATHLARTRKKLRDPLLQSRIQDRLAFWQRTLVAKWQRAFSQTTANKRFAVLGLVLLAALAEVCWTTGIVAVLEHLGQAEIERVLEQFAREEWDQGDGSVKRNEENEDVGEIMERGELSVDGTVVSRNVNRTIVASAEDDEIATSSQAEPLEAERYISSTLRTSKRASTADILTPKKKKRRRGGNAIDDLFANF